MPVASRALPARTAPLSPAWTVLNPRRRTPWLTLLLAGLLLGNLSLYVLTVAQEAALNRAQAEIFAKRQQNVRLRAELATAESPDRVERMAMAQNMIQPESSLFLPALPPDPTPLTRVQAPTFGVPEAY